MKLLDLFSICNLLCYKNLDFEFWVFVPCNLNNSASFWRENSNILGYKLRFKFFFKISQDKSDPDEIVFFRSALMLFFWRNKVNKERQVLKRRQNFLIMTSTWNLFFFALLFQGIFLHPNGEICAASAIWRGQKRHWITRVRGVWTLPSSQCTLQQK